MDDHLYWFNRQKNKESEAGDDVQQFGWTFWQKKYLLEGIWRRETERWENDWKMTVRKPAEKFSIVLLRTGESDRPPDIARPKTVLAPFVCSGFGSAKSRPTSGMRRNRCRETLCFGDH
jgi:hypothetical protein